MCKDQGECNHPQRNRSEHRTGQRQRRQKVEVDALGLDDLRCAQDPSSKDEESRTQPAAQLTPSKHNDQANDHSQNHGQEQQKEAGGRDPADGEPIVAFDPVHEVAGGLAQDEHRDSTKDAANQKPRPAAGGASQQDPTPHERNVLASDIAEGRQHHRIGQGLVGTFVLDQPTG